MTSLVVRLVELGVHLGHKVNKWNAKGTSFLLVARGGIHVIDLEQTIPMMRRALTFVQQICDKRGKVTLTQKNARPFLTDKQWIPSCVVITDVKQNLPLLRTSLKLRWTIVAVLSSDVDLLGIGYPIPAGGSPRIYNDLVLSVARDAVESEPFPLYLRRRTTPKCITS